MISIVIFSKGQNSVKNVGGVMVLLIMLYICTKICVNIPKG